MSDFFSLGKSHYLYTAGDWGDQVIKSGVCVTNCGFLASGVTLPWLHLPQVSTFCAETGFSSASSLKASANLCLQQLMPEAWLSSKLQVTLLSVETDTSVKSLCLLGWWQNLSKLSCLSLTSRTEGWTELGTSRG